MSAVGPQRPALGGLAKVRAEGRGLAVASSGKVCRTAAAAKGRIQTTTIVTKCERAWSLKERVLCMRVTPLHFFNTRSPLVLSK